MLYKSCIYYYSFFLTVAVYLIISLMYFVQIVFYSHLPFNPFFSNDSKLAFFYGESIEKFDIVISKVESLEQRLGRLEALLVKPKVVSIGRQFRDVKGITSLDSCTCSPISSRWIYIPFGRYVVWYDLWVLGDLFHILFSILYIKS